MSNADFKAAFAKLCAVAADRMDAVVIKVTEDLTRRIVLRSPVGDPSQWTETFIRNGVRYNVIEGGEGRKGPPGYTGGTFRANWNLAFNAPDKSTRDSRANDTRGRAVAELIKYQTGQTIYITNSMPYAARLEFEGWSKQAPAGMVRVTVAEYGAALRKAVAAVRRTA